ncbi:MAG: DUF3108 domain-containing protein [Formivibrio sp.]|nr:DUF3108 domain-containing protein [Formivibrio sp.]
MPLRPWLRRTLWGAFILSLLLHVISIFSEEIYAWLTKPVFEQTELKKPTRKLKALSLEEETPSALAGIKPPDTLLVYLHKQPQTKVVHKPVRKPAKPRPIVIASAPPAISVNTPVIVTGIAPTLVASQPEALASAAASLPTNASRPQNRQAEQERARFPNDLKVTYVYGIIPAQMSWKVVNGHYDLRLEVGFLGTSRLFHSSGKVNNKGLIPERFVEYRNGKPDPYYQVDFDWNALTAEVGEPGKRKIETIATGDQDIFSTAFNISLIGGDQAEQTFSIFSGRRKYENAQLSLAGEAKLRLGQKEINALLLRGKWDDRQVDFWLAPEWNNIPVRMTITLGKDLSLDIWANQISIDGKTVLEWIKPQSNKLPGERGNK